MKAKSIPTLICFLLIVVFFVVPLVAQDCDFVLQKTLSGHSGYVYSVSFNPDGRLLASGGGDNTIKLWDVETGHELKTLQGHSGYVYSVSFSPDGRLLASGSGSGDYTIKLWDVETGKELQTLRGHTAWVRSVCFSPDGLLLASGSDDKTIRLWDVKTGREVKTLKGHTDWVRSVCFSPDGRLLASGSRDNTVKLWDVKTGREVKALRGHIAWVSSVSFSPDGLWLASGSGDNTIKLWNVKTGREVKTLKGHTRMVSSVCFSPDGLLLASGSGYKTINLWEILLQRGFPPDLFANLEFKDENGNGLLEATETTTIQIQLSNKGKGPAHRLDISIEDDQPDPSLIIKDQYITILQPDETVTVNVPVETGVHLKTADHRLEINVREHFGYDMDPAYLHLSTLGYQPPVFFVAGIEIKDSGEGTFARVEDGQLQAGEQVRVKVVIQNVGQGVAKGVKYFVSSGDENIYLDKNTGSLGKLEPGEVKEFWISVSPNKRVTKSGFLPIALSITESVGQAAYEDLLPIKLDSKPPSPTIVEVKPDVEKLQRQIARFEYKSSKFTSQVSTLVDVQTVPPSKTRRKNSVAVIFGAENYKWLPQALYATNDADLMKKYLEKRLGVDQVVTYKNEEVSGFIFENVFNPINGELQTVIIPGETEVFVYYSGHGLPDKSGTAAYLFPIDGKKESYETQGYSLNKLYENLNKLGAKSVTVILDACFSGASRHSEKVATKSLIAHKPAALRIQNPAINYPNFSVMCSSACGETSLGFDQAQTGLFTYYLAAGLKGEADGNGDRKITLGELKRYVTEKVQETSRKIYGLQKPEFYGDENRVLVEW